GRGSGARTPRVVEPEDLEVRGDAARLDPVDVVVDLLLLLEERTAVIARPRVHRADRWDRAEVAVVAVRLGDRGRQSPVGEDSGQDDQGADEHGDAEALW